LWGPEKEDTVGQLTADGDPTNVSPGKITSGTLDINNFGTLQAAQANTGTYDASIATSGRTTMALTSTGGTPHGFVLYFVSRRRFLALARTARDRQLPRSRSSFSSRIVLATKI